MESLVTIFFAIIAASALLQAGSVIALVLTARKAARAMDRLETQLGADFPRHLQTVTNVSERVSALADVAVSHSERAGNLVEEAGVKVDKAIARLATLTARASAATEEPQFEMEDVAELEADEDDIGPLPGRIGHAYAVFKGLRRALTVWRNGASPAAPPSPS